MTSSLSAGTRRRRLLVVDDDFDNIELIRRAFRDHYDIHYAKDGIEGLELARRIVPDVIVTDERIPNLCGIDFLAIAAQEMPRTIRVLVSGYTDFALAVKAVNQAHVHHYVEKPFHSFGLVTTVNSLVHAHELESERDALLSRITRTVRDLDRANHLLAESETQMQKLVVERTQELTRANIDLMRANELMGQLAVRDGLTGLFNHRYFLEHFALEMARAERYNRALGLILIDIDEFEGVNYRFGHVVADQVLIKVAQVVQGNGVSQRRSDFAVRYGGDEFGLLLSETNASGSLCKAERIRQSIETIDWSNIVSRLAQSITVSIGVAVFPDHGVSPPELTAAAEKALARAKSEGCNHVICA